MNIQKSLINFFFFLFSATFYANVTIINGLTHIYNTEVGSILNGEIILKNTSSEKEERVIIYLKDFYQLCDEKTNYLDVGESKNSLGKWITFNTTEKVLLPNERFVISYQLKIPEKLNLEGKKQGSFWSMIMVEVEDPINEQEKRGVKINSKIRYGIQLVANIGQKIDPEIEFNDVKLIKLDDKRYQVKVKLQNKGRFMVKPSLILELLDENGESVLKTEAQFKKVYPNGCKDFIIELTNVPSGMYEGVLVADYGGDIYGINLTVDITDN